MPLDPDEQVIWSQRANHSAGRRAVGGKLYLTDRRLLFKPNVGRSKEWSASRTEVTGFGVQPRGGANPFDGSLRSRLRVELRQEEPQLFVVSKLDQAVRDLTEALSKP